MNTNLIFDTSIYGHHLEYVHHLHEMAVEDTSRRYVFVLPGDFENIKNKFDWKAADNVVFELLSKKQIDYCNHTNLLKAAWRKSCMLRKYVKLYNASFVFLIMLMQFIPFVLFLLPAKVKIGGIVYRIGLYKWKSMTWRRKAIEIMRFWLMSRIKNLSTAFILNDSSAASVYNRRYTTQKFQPLPDPFAIPDYTPKNIRRDLSISLGQKVLLHFGSMTGRKGTVTILQAVNHIPQNLRNNYVLIFAGKVKEDIRKQFYELTDKLKGTIRIIVYDEFVSFERISDLCFSSDGLLIPYTNTIQSSGLIGYASKYNKPVIGPADALLGKLIRKYRLGYVGNVKSPYELAQLIMKSNFNIAIPSTYCEDNRTENFKNTIKTLCCEK